MSSEATIRRGVRNSRYAAIPNHVFEDSRLSMEARWLLSYLLSKPDNWTVVIGDIIKKGNCGRDKARGMIAELVKFGYAEREQQRADGKFGSSVLVIFDEPRDSHAAEIVGETSGVAFLPQTDLPATVSPSPVPPSPVKSAHSNNLDSANTDCQKEREGARAGSEESDTSVVEDRKRIERDFKAWYRTWPTSLNDSEQAARDAWAALTPEERAACIERTPTFISAVKAIKGKFTFSSVYLKGKAWEKLDDPKSEVALPTVHNPFSRAWMAGMLAILLRPPLTANMPAPTKFQLGQIAQGGDEADAVRIDRLQKYGWPRVNTMHQRAFDRQGVTVPPPLVAISEGFEQVHRDADLAKRWKRAFERRGWPWLPNTGHEWFFFPAGEPDEALAKFSEATARERGDDDAA
ncbi:helix-turn-helix domain-containing protein [Rhizobium ruizarguesonis]|uniref:helix-turn-helix domain-containing protein n=1 Tax=Rhizobium ruizarguesonis TaxID=2081791 RepID=UPI0038579F91